MLDRFASFLDSLTEPITFHIVQDEREVEAIGALYQIPYKRFFVETHSQVDSLVQKLGTRMTRVHALPSIKTGRASTRSTSSTPKATMSRPTASRGSEAPSSRASWPNSTRSRTPSWST